MSEVHKNSCSKQSYRCTKPDKQAERRGNTMPASNSEVLVYREKRGCTGPRKLLVMEVMRCTIEILYGPVDFQSKFVKVYK